MNPLNHIEKPLTETAANEIIQYIISNALEAGDRLPNEFNLAEILGVGRGTVREAVKLLVSRNILEIRRGAGTFISQKQGIPEDPLGLTFIKNKEQLTKDLLSVRLMLEPEIAGMAALHGTKEQKEELEKQCNVVEKLILEDADHTEEDVKFHTLIAKSSGNIIIEKLIPIINSSVVLFSDITHRTLRSETIETHRDITEAIKASNSIEAKYAMEMHLIYNRKVIMSIMNAK